MDLKRLLLAGTFNFSLAVFAGLFGLTQTFGDVLGFDPFSRRFWLSLLSAGDPIRDFIIAHQVATAVAGVVLLVLIGVVTGVVRTVLTDFGFRLDRTGVGLRRRRGLLTRTDVTLPIRRAQAAVIATGPVRDRFGWRELRLQSLAKDEGSRGAHVVAPLARDEEVGDNPGPARLAALPHSIGWVRVSRAYVGILAVAMVPLYVAAIANLILVPLAGAAFVVALLAVIAVRVPCMEPYRLCGRRRSAAHADGLVATAMTVLLPQGISRASTFARASSADCSASRPCRSAWPEAE